jgi:hypothetical protein
VKPVVANMLLNNEVRVANLTDKTGLTAEKIFSGTEGINPGDNIRIGELEFTPNLNYRQVGPGTALRFVNTGKQFAPATYQSSNKDGISLSFGAPLDNPMYAHGFLWYGADPKTLEGKVQQNNPFAKLINNTKILNNTQL